MLVHFATVSAAADGAGGVEGAVAPGAVVVTTRALALTRGLGGSRMAATSVQVAQAGSSDITALTP